jgi:hypothetical protein
MKDERERENNSILQSIILLAFSFPPPMRTGGIEPYPRVRKSPSFVLIECQVPRKLIACYEIELAKITSATI